MSEHIHVRLADDLGVGVEGELVERYRCRCGETWTRTYRADGDPEQ